MSKIENEEIKNLFFDRLLQDVDSLPSLIPFRDSERYYIRYFDKEKKEIVKDLILQLIGINEEIYQGFVNLVRNEWIEEDLYKWIKNEERELPYSVFYPVVENQVFSEFLEEREGKVYFKEGLPYEYSFNPSLYNFFEELVMVEAWEE